MAVTVVSVGIFFFLKSDLRSADSRMILWRDSIPLISKNLLVGSGPETFYQTFQTVLTKDIFLSETLYNVPDRVHSSPLQILLDFGILGFSLYAWFIWWLATRWFQSKNTDETRLTLAMISASLLSVLFSFALSAQMIAFLGILAALFATTLRWKKREIKLMLTGKVVVSMLVVTFSIFSLIHAFSIMKMNNQLSKGISDFFVDQKQTALEFRDALEWNHYRYPLVTAIHFLTGSNQLKGDLKVQKNIQKDIEKLAALTNGGYPSDLAAAKFEIMKGNSAGAGKDFENALKKAPNLPIIYQDWGSLAYENGDVNQAISLLEKLEEFAPPYWRNDWGSKTHEEDEKKRIFRKNHGLFLEAMSTLAQAYTQNGQSEKATTLEKELMP